MEEFKKRIHDDSNGLDYVLVGDYYIPDLKLPKESQPIGRWDRMHQVYLQEHRPGQYNELLLAANSTGKLYIPVDIEGNAIDLIPLSIASFIELK